MKLNFFCEFNQTGVGRHAQSFYVALRSLVQEQFEIRYVHSGLGSVVTKFLHSGVAEDDVTLFFWRQSQDFLAEVRGTKILWLVFESDSLPKIWLEQVAAFDEIWSPTEWGKSILVEHGLNEEKIIVIPEGINERIYRKLSTAHQDFIFLHVGKYEQRKSIDEIIHCFKLEFPLSHYPNVKLWLKADFFTRPERIGELKEEVKSDPRINVISGNLSEEKMAKLYNQADAFIYPSKSEGFGLTGLEAIACGLPLMAIDYSGQHQYLQSIAGLFYPIRYKLRAITDPDYVKYYGSDYVNEPLGSWAVPELKSICAGMREIYSHHLVWRQRAEKAAKTIHEEFSWQTIAKQALKILDRVQIYDQF